MAVKTGVSLVANWEKRITKAGQKFAKLITIKAVYDRVAVIDDRAHVLIIQWPKGISKKRNLNTANCGSETHTIKQETINKEDVKELRYYKD